MNDKGTRTPLEMDAQTIQEKKEENEKKKKKKTQAHMLSYKGRTNEAEINLKGLREENEGRRP